MREQYFIIVRKPMSGAAVVSVHTLWLNYLFATQKTFPWCFVFMLSRGVQDIFFDAYLHCFFSFWLIVFKFVRYYLFLFLGCAVTVYRVSLSWFCVVYRNSDLFYELVIIVILSPKKLPPACWSRSLKKQAATTEIVLMMARLSIICGMNS